MKQTARNQFGLNDEIKRFDKSNLKKRPSPPKAKRRNAMKPQTPKVTANLANALGGVAEKDKRGDATMGQMVANETKNAVAGATSQGKGFFW